MGQSLTFKDRADKDRAERIQENSDFCGELSIFINKTVYLNTACNKSWIVHIQYIL